MEFQLNHAHTWDVSPKEAVAIQRDLVHLVSAKPIPEPVQTIAGVDVSVRGDRVQTAIVVIQLPELEIIDQAVWRGPVVFPYVPGLLSFREMPAILPALEQLNSWPDVFMTDSHGLAHPRRFGLACHLGVLLDTPTLGVAKSLLIGIHDTPGLRKGDQVVLRDKKNPGEILGQVVRTRDRVKPVYVSIGHRITLEQAVELTLSSTTRYRLPEPTRQAHLLSKEIV
jgi:deoxyribonuclease V